MLTTTDVWRSRARRDILALFFLNPDKPFYQRQLERILGIPVGNIRRELLRFERDELMKREPFGNLCLFRLNPAHPLYGELRDLVLKTAGIAQRLRNILADVEGLRLAFLYGSYVRDLAGDKGTPWTGESDIDLAVVGSARRSAVAKVLRDTEKAIQRTINLLVYSTEEFHRKVDKDPFLRDILSGPILPVLGMDGHAGTKPVRVTRGRMKQLLRRKER
ncbi:MAG: nucleotidyltransferase domain-containing protein [Planctomycetota bacterium]|jgi:predicted nucleotidyltransferase